MANGVNKVVLVGNVGSDPEYKDNPGVLNFRVATNETWKGKDGEKKERAEWHRVGIFGKSAEALSRFLAKGMLVYVEGKIRTREYEKNGEKRFSTDIVADTVQVLSSKQGGGKPSAAEESKSEVESDDQDIADALNLGGSAY